MLEEKNETKTDISTTIQIREQTDEKFNTKRLICKVPQKMHAVDKIIEIHLKMEKNNSKSIKKR